MGLISNLIGLIILVPLLLIGYVAYVITTGAANFFSGITNMIANFFKCSLGLGCCVPEEERGQTAVGMTCECPDECESGYCKDEMCDRPALLGEPCGYEGDAYGPYADSDGGDEDCKGNLYCGQYANNDYKCCKKHQYTFGDTSDWCGELKPGDGCIRNAQCGIEGSNDYCDDATKVCKKPAQLGEQCNGTGDDSSCAVGVCGQMDDDNYVCCEDTSPLWTFSDWCLGLENGEKCGMGGQCKSGHCAATTLEGDYKCVEEECFCDIWDTKCKTFRWHDASKFDC